MITAYSFLCQPPFNPVRGKSKICFIIRKILLFNDKKIFSFSFPIKKKKMYVRFQDPWVCLFYFGFHLMQFVFYYANKTSLRKGFSYPLERLVILSMINSREIISKEIAVTQGRGSSSRTQSCFTAVPLTVRVLATATFPECVSQNQFA